MLSFPRLALALSLPSHIHLNCLEMEGYIIFFTVCSPSHFHLIPFVLGILSVLSGILVILLPETKGVPLPETVEDVEQLARYHL